MKLYEKIANQIFYLIEHNILKPGDRILSIREARIKHKVSISTILQAYLSLENKGIIESRPQSGYYVRAQVKNLLQEPNTSTPQDVSSEVDVSQSVFAILNTIRRPDVIPLGSPFPSSHFFPHQLLHKYLYAASRHIEPLNAFGDLPPGNEELRKQIANRYIQKGMMIPIDDIIITYGATEAINLCLQAVTKPGDIIAIESPVFYAVLHAIERLGLRALEIPTHSKTGIDLAALDQTLKKHSIAACIVMTNFQNPLGSLMPDENKQALVKLLADHQVPLIEDDVYQELYFSPSPPLPAKAYDKTGLVLHCSSFSKTLAPGFRIGWTIPGRFTQKVERLKFINTLILPPLPQIALAEYLKHEAYDRHLRKLRQVFEVQLHQLQHAINKYFPAATKITYPQGGYVLWVELPESINALSLFQKALQHKISLAPGPIFSAKGEFQNYIRLNYGQAWTEQYLQAVKTLGQLAAE